MFLRYALVSLLVCGFSTQAQWIPAGSGRCQVSITGVPDGMACHIENPQIDQETTFCFGGWFGMHCDHSTSTNITNHCQSKLVCHNAKQDYTLSQEISYTNGSKTFAYPFGYSETGCFKECVRFNNLSPTEKANKTKTCEVSCVKQKSFTPQNCENYCFQKNDSSQTCFDQCATTNAANQAKAKAAAPGVLKACQASCAKTLQDTVSAIPGQCQKACDTQRSSCNNACTSANKACKGEGCKRKLFDCQVNCNAEDTYHSNELVKACNIAVNHVPKNQTCSVEVISAKEMAHDMCTTKITCQKNPETKVIKYSADSISSVDYPFAHKKEVSKKTTVPLKPAKAYNAAPPAPTVTNSPPPAAPVAPTVTNSPPPAPTTDEGTPQPTVSMATVSAPAQSAPMATILPQPMVTQPSESVAQEETQEFGSNSGFNSPSTPALTPTVSAPPSASETVSQEENTEFGGGGF